jgi:hypothetical protein
VSRNRGARKVDLERGGKRAPFFLDAESTSGEGEYRTAWLRNVSLEVRGEIVDPPQE